jgi:hypothetical protein
MANGIFNKRRQPRIKWLEDISGEEKVMGREKNQKTFFIKDCSSLEKALV